MSRSFCSAKLLVAIPREQPSWQFLLRSQPIATRAAVPQITPSAPRAIALITSKPAEIHGIEELGSVESGKLASFVVWSGDPFDLRSRITAVVAEGKYMEIEP